MHYEIHLDPKIVALAAAGAATLGLPLNEALLRPVVKRKEQAARPAGSPARLNHAHTAAPAVAHREGVQE